MCRVDVGNAHASVVDARKNGICPTDSLPTSNLSGSMSQWFIGIETTMPGDCPSLRSQPIIELLRNNGELDKSDQSQRTQSIYQDAGTRCSIGCREGPHAHSKRNVLRGGASNTHPADAAAHSAIKSKGWLAYLLRAPYGTLCAVALGLVKSLHAVIQTGNRQRVSVSACQSYSAGPGRAPVFEAIEHEFMG